MEKLTFTVKEAAQAANVSIPTLYAWAKTAGFPVVKVGRKLVVPIDAFRRWLEEQAKGNSAPDDSAV
ncbi:helix-turn-helix domain-containing protein [Faecousia sp.]|uniref:helix-turn-helix domain-containing protein n=1 Tax=Faecousia sp. TaxID=2952921 RepID=UPI003AB5C309